jgi:hypothetical protein
MSKAVKDAIIKAKKGHKLPATHAAKMKSAMKRSMPQTITVTVLPDRHISAKGLFKASKMTRKIGPLRRIIVNGVLRFVSTKDKRYFDVPANYYRFRYMVPV